MKSCDKCKSMKWIKPLVAIPSCEQCRKLIVDNYKKVVAKLKEFKK